MKIGTLLALLALVAYVAIEVTALERAQHRMRPDHIFQRLVAARVGVATCGEVSDAQTRAFEARLAGVRARLRDDIAETQPELDAAAIEARIAALARAAEVQATDTLAAAGCTSFMARRLLRRHEIEARRQ
jgi:hypothetical protein